MIIQSTAIHTNSNHLTDTCVEKEEKYNLATEKITILRKSMQDPLVTLAKEEYPDIHAIIGRVKKKFSKKFAHENAEQILLIIKLIVSHERHKRFIHRNKLQFDSNTCDVLDSLKDYQYDEVINYITHDSPSKSLRKLINIVVDEMVTLFRRKEVTKKKYDANEKLLVYTQSHGHISQRGKLVKEQTLSSELHRRHYSFNMDYNCNLGKLTLRSANGVKELLVVRSGRSENISKLLKLLQFNFLASWESHNKPGVTLSSEGRPTFLMTIFTGLDAHPLRNILKKFQYKEPLDEKSSLVSMKKAIEEIWGDFSCRNIQVVLEDGSELVFEAEKPLIHNFVLSKSTQDKQVILDSREWSLVSTIREFDRLRKLDSVLESSLFGKEFHDFNGRVSLETNPSVEEIVAFLDKISVEFNTSTIADNSLDKKLYMALQAVSICLRNCDLQGQSYLDEDSPGLELFYHFYLSELINSSVSVQCKAGCDRALIMTCMRLAQIQIEKEKQIIYDFPQDKGVLDFFEEEFTSFFSKFGGPVLEICRGKRLMKGLDKPILKRILSGKLIENSIPGIQLISGT